MLEYNSLLQSISIAVLLQVQIGVGEVGEEDEDEDEGEDWEDKSESHTVLWQTEHLTSRYFASVPGMFDICRDEIYIDDDVIHYMYWGFS